MKKVLLILTIVSIICSCNATPTNIIDSTSVIVEEEVNEILFDYSNVIDIIYLSEDYTSIIRYDDADVFDLDNMAFITGREEWYGNYVDMIIDEGLLPDFIYNYDNYKYTDDAWRKDKLNDEWLIEEHKITYLDGTVDLIYYIVPSHERSND